MIWAFVIALGIVLTYAITMTVLLTQSGKKRRGADEAKHKAELALKDALTENTRLMNLLDASAEALEREKAARVALRGKFDAAMEIVKKCRNPHVLAAQLNSHFEEEE